MHRRLTTAGRLREQLSERSRQRWRHLLDDLLGDVEHGVRSSLELRWLRDVERAHGLAPSRLNHAEDLATGREYRDFEFEEFGLVVETDGREGHPIDEAFRDRRRDNRVTVGGRCTLRYGWREITGEPCGAADEVADVLRRLGWTGDPYPCRRPECRLRPERGDPVS